MTRKSTCLNGLWSFACGTDSLSTLPASWEDVPIQVPSPFNINSFARGYHKHTGGEELYVSGGDYRLYPEYPAHWEEARYGFYRRNLFIPEESRGNRLFLRFEGVAFYSVYYLNGVIIGEESEAFLPIEIEITDKVHYGAENELIVGACAASTAHYTDENGKKRTDMPEGSFWGGHIAGIWQDVWLDERPAVYITELFAYCDTAKKQLTIRCAHEQPGGALAFTLTPWSASNIESNNRTKERLLDTAAAGNEYTWFYHDGDITLWDTDTPALYTLCARLYDGDTLLDETDIRIGFRTFTADGGCFRLNGKPLKLRSDSWHYMGYSVQTPDYARAWFNMARDANANIIRLHAQPFPSFYYDMADETGMLLVSESAIWASHCNFSYNDAFFENGKRHVQRLVERDRNHPSVVMWSAENECVMAWKVCGSQYIRDIDDLSEKIYTLAEVINPLDPSRLVYCDGSGDLNGRLPVYSLHYPGNERPVLEAEKPITIGEMGGMYYATPDHIGDEIGERVFSHMDGRLESVARDAYRKLMHQRRWAAQVCVFNLVWYGLEPLPFADRLLAYDSNIAPGIKPSRITPYMRTLNAGAQDGLPDYIPNPVFEWTKRAFAPLCFMAESLPVSGWCGETVSIPVTLYNDHSEMKPITLRVQLDNPGTTNEAAEKIYALQPCTHTDDVLPTTLPDIPGEYTLTFILYNGEEPIQREERTVYACVPLGEAVPVSNTVQTEPGEPFASYMKTTHVRRIFSDNDSFTFDAPLEIKYFDAPLPFNARPLYFDGSGRPVAVSLCEAGESGVVCGLDFAKYWSDPQVQRLFTVLNKQAATGEILPKPKPAYLLGSPDGNTAAMLDALGCAYEIIHEDQLRDLCKHTQERTLIADAGKHTGWLTAVNGRNFSRVLLLNLTQAPDILAAEFTVTRRKAFHLQKRVRDTTSQNEVPGVYGNSLYGLQAGQEMPLAEHLLRYHTVSEAVVLGLPDIDWRMWNHNAEYLKTAAVHKSHMTDNRTFSALSRHTYAGSIIWVSQIPTEPQNPRALALYARILSMLGCSMSPAPKNELADYIGGGLYIQRVTGMLYRPFAAVEQTLITQPGLNRVERGSAWRRIEDGMRIAPGVLALYLYSPQDRTDFLLNPDTVDMHVQGEEETECLINGSPQGKGQSYTVTSLTLNAGANLILFRCKKSMSIPKIQFNRINGRKLDLRFSLYDQELKPLPLSNALVYSDTQPQGVRDAVGGSSKYWHSSCDQCAGIDLGITFPSPVVCRALYFNGVTDEHRGVVFTPRRFKLLAGDTPDTLRPVYEALPEEQMSYRDGRVFIRLDDLTARCFKLVLTENALKPWIVSDLTLLG